MTARCFIMNAGRTSKQGQQINVGKDNAEYQAIVSTLIHAPRGPEGARRRRRAAPSGSESEYGGEATFHCQEGKVPRGMIFVPYGPPTCRLMGVGDRRHRDADLQGLGSRGRADRPERRRRSVQRTEQRDREHRERRHDRETRTETAETVDGRAVHRRAGPERASAAWEEVDAGRYMPRRIRGSCQGRALG